MTFHTRSEVDRLLAELDVVALRETERDGEAFSGPKHWHVYDIIARSRSRAPVPTGLTGSTRRRSSGTDCP